MGMYFYVGTAPTTPEEYRSLSRGPEIWDRSWNTSFMFCAQIAALAEMLKLPSGVHDTGMDEVYIDPPVLRAFLAATFDYLSRSGSLPLRRMLIGVVQTALFLDARATGTPFPIPPGFDDIEQDLDDIS
ncbi:hypothetical protein BJY16_004950 [Actinoplanes octamycinicus]|uniref:Uncharacterized protein n=1 Tax=Actinoplanes octamycinicus TaxID=135948 RepID=A0A7W7H030_9ACTN|nr:DUF6086 family protein [Actinoplanes octamycinicus]MBB4741491.1 hypothetical protein [Actinoplanes octamycinicus]GIE57041.1 hypothetical protein Aoc01nite_24430 [Actinoplanes octamycinicus]